MRFKVYTTNLAEQDAPTLELLEATRLDSRELQGDAASSIRDTQAPTVRIMEIDKALKGFAQAYKND
jgi:hypothetical protein